MNASTVFREKLVGGLMKILSNMLIYRGQLLIPKCFLSSVKSSNPSLFVLNSVPLEIP